MIRNVMIDCGPLQGNRCAEWVETTGLSPSHRIGEVLGELLEQRGFSVTLASHLPELTADGIERGAGRPAACAYAAKCRGIDLLLRLWVCASELPRDGTVKGVVYRRGSVSHGLSDAILSSVSGGSDLRSEGTRCSSHYLLLRRAPCHGVILLLGLPFHRRERLTDAEAKTYAALIANGIFARCGQG